jgi:YD repeat-containing protein
MRADRRIFWRWSLFLLAFPSIAAAAETKTYTYDALGRLVVVKSAGSVNANQIRSYCYDKAGNRVEVDAKTDSSGTPASCVTTG